jgi:hypothetical protein
VTNFSSRRRPVVWDVFPYWREEWTIEARRALWAHFMPQVDHRLIILTGDRTHRGAPLPLPSGIPSGDDEIVIRVTLDADSDWGREAQQRDAVVVLLPRMGDDDLVLVCDADELVDPRQYTELLTATAQGARKLAMSLYLFGTRWRYPVQWVYPTAFRARHMPPSPSQLRWDQTISPVTMAGWHISYVGTDTEIDAKLSAFAHAEFDTRQQRTLLVEARASATDFLGKPLLDDPIDPAITEVLEAAGVSI